MLLDDQVEPCKKLIPSPTNVVSEFDKFSIWLLAGTGATATLLVSNLEGVTGALKSGVPSWLFALLAVSGLFGFIAKLCYIRVKSSLTVMEHVVSAIESGKNVNIHLALKELLSIFPSWARLAGKKASEKAKTDPLYGVRIISRCAIFQGIYTLLQGLTFIVFIAVASIGIK